MQAAAAAAAAGSNSATPAASPQRLQQQQQLQGGYSPGLSPSELLPSTPMPLEELEASMLSSAAKKKFAEELPEIDLDGDFSFEDLKFAGKLGEWRPVVV
jgi:hypothetical protein